MSSEQLEHLLSLPLADRVTLAEALWDSIHREEIGRGESADTVREALRRNSELVSGVTTGRSHAEVMAAARQAIE